MAPKTVLLVDDDKDSVAVYRTMLVHRGYRVVVASDGEHCLRLAREERPALILLDLWMPVLDGWAAAERLKADPQTQSIVVIALTAHAEAASEERARHAAFAAYLTKPIEPQRVVEEVMRRIGPPAD